MQLDPRATLYFLLQRALLWVMLGLWLASMFGGILASGHPARDPGALFCPAALYIGALLGLDTLVCRARARSYVIELGPEAVAVQHGILRTVHETLLYGKIQDILVTRNVLQRLLGLATVVLQSASGAPQVIPALGAAQANALRDEILRRSAAPGRADAPGFSTGSSRSVSGR
jgi:membrane protein YdbS with pleckstrin-like domain